MCGLLQQNQIYQNWQMSIKHRSSRAEIQKQLQNIRPSHRQSIQHELLLHKIKALQAKLLQQSTITDTLKFHNQDLDHQLLSKNSVIDRLKQENAELKRSNQHLQQQLKARKKSSQDIIRQLRQENCGIKEKNIKMCQIVNFLEQQAEQFKQKILESKTIEQGLRKRVQQLTTENQNIRKRMAKSQVDSQKYKLKALEGEKYWSSKLQKSKMKQHEVYIQKSYNIQAMHKQQVIMLKSDVLRYEKIVKIKQEQIKSLEDRIEQILLQKQ